MSREVIERCDVCSQVVSDVLCDCGDGYGYIQAKRYRWRFGPWPRFWHLDVLGWEIVCDLCLDAVRELRESRVLGGAAALMVFVPTLVLR